MVVSAIPSPNDRKKHTVLPMAKCRNLQSRVGPEFHARCTCSKSTASALLLVVAAPIRNLISIGSIQCEVGNITDDFAALWVGEELRLRSLAPSPDQSEPEEAELSPLRLAPVREPRCSHDELKGQDGEGFFIGIAVATTPNIIGQVYIGNFAFHKAAQAPTSAGRNRNFSRNGGPAFSRAQPGSA